jgi:capsular polysaccharide biosynthesis protein
MELRQYAVILWRRKWLVLLATAVTVSIVTIGTYRVTPVYGTTTKLRVALAHSGSMEYVDYIYAERLMNTYAEILHSRPVLEEVIQRLDLRIAPETVAEKIRAEVLANTELMTIRVEDTDPQRATAIANVLAGLLVEQSHRLYTGAGRSAREILEEQLEAVERTLEQDRKTLGNMTEGRRETKEDVDALRYRIALQEETNAMLLRQYEEARLAEAMRANSVSVVEPAIEPTTPSKPRKVLNIVLGALVGSLGGAALALLLENLEAPPREQARRRKTLERLAPQPSAVSVSTIKAGQSSPMSTEAEASVSPVEPPVPGGQLERRPASRSIAQKPAPPTGQGRHGRRCVAAMLALVVLAAALVPAGIVLPTPLGALAGATIGLVSALLLKELYDQFSRTAPSVASQDLRVGTATDQRKGMRTHR